MRKRCFRLAICCCFFFLTTYLVIKRLYRDDCHAGSCIALICSQYAKNKISGTLCKNLCDDKSTWLVCQKNEPSLQAFISSDYTLIVCNNYVKSNTLNVSRKESNATIAFDSLTQYLGTISIMLSNLYGKGDYTEVLEKILPLLDMNNDGIYSQDEIGTMFSLLSSKDFMYRLLFWNSPYFPQIIGVCGNAYALSYPPYMIDLQYTSNHRFKEISYLEWEARMTIATNLISFFSKALRKQLGSSHLLYFPALPTKIGLTAQFDAQILFPTDVLYTLNRKCANSSCYPSIEKVPNGKLHNDCFNLSDESDIDLCLTRVGIIYLCRLLEEALALLKGPDSEQQVILQLQQFISQCRGLSTSEKKNDDLNYGIEIDLSVLRHNIFSTIWDFTHLRDFNYSKYDRNLKRFALPYPNEQKEKEMRKRMKDGFSYL